MHTQQPESQQLLKENFVLEDAKKLNDLKVENDDVLALTFMQPGEPAWRLLRRLLEWDAGAANGMPG